MPCKEGILSAWKQNYCNLFSWYVCVQPELKEIKCPKGFSDHRSQILLRKGLAIFFYEKSSLNILFWMHWSFPSHSETWTLLLLWTFESQSLSFLPCHLTMWWILLGEGVVLILPYDEQRLQDNNLPREAQQGCTWTDHWKEIIRSMMIIIDQES